MDNYLLNLTQACIERKLSDTLIADYNLHLVYLVHVLSIYNIDQYRADCRQSYVHHCAPIIFVHIQSQLGYIMKHRNFDPILPISH